MDEEQEKKAARPPRPGDDVLALRMHFVSMMRPELHQPWNTPSPDGRTLAEAAFALVPEVFRGHVSRLLAAVAAGGAVLVTDAKFIEERQRYWLYLPRLQAGEFTVRGREPGTGKLLDMPVDMLDDAEPDFQNNHLTCCGGMRFVSIRVFGEPVTSATREPVKLAPLARAQKWMRDNVPGATPPWKRVIAIATCRDQARVTERVARQAWNSLDQKDRGKTGRHK